MDGRLVGAGPLSSTTPELSLALSIGMISFQRGFTQPLGLSQTIYGYSVCLVLLLNDFDLLYTSGHHFENTQNYTDAIQTHTRYSLLHDNHWGKMGLFSSQHNSFNIYT